MIITALEISLMVVFIHYTLQDGEIFGGLGRLFSRVLPEWIHKPVFDCLLSNVALSLLKC